MGKFADEFNKFLTTTRTEKMKAVIADRENFDPGDRRMMVNVLRNLAKKLNAYANDLEAPGDGLRSGEHQEAARRAGARQLSHS
jgi:hypothetical protein